MTVLVAGVKLPEMKKNPHAVALGRLGGLKGGRARAAALSPERRTEIARQAIGKRWEEMGKMKNGKKEIKP